MTRIAKVFRLCGSNWWLHVLFYVDIFIFVAGSMANLPLLCLFLRERKTLSSSQVLGVNLVLMNLIFLSIIPASLIFYKVENRHNHSDFLDIELQDLNTATPVIVSRDVFNMFNLVGCPLLLACMCIERYLAVLRPVLYLRLRKWEYRTAVSAAVWCVTLSFCLVAGFVHDIALIMIPVSALISFLFLVMLACLGCMVHALWQQCPAHSSPGKQARPESPLKRKTLENVSLVVVSAVMSYLPVMVMVPIYYVAITGNVMHFQRLLCSISELYLLSPRLGVFIGPLFYVSRARQMCCHQGAGKTFNE